LPLLFGCVNGAEENDERFRAHSAAAQGDTTRTTFPGGWFAASAHGGRRATWTDQRGLAWAVLGERGLSAPTDGSEGGRRYALDDRGQLALSSGARGVVAVFDTSRRRLTIGTDPLNYFPVYYRHSGGAFTFGSNLSVLSRITGAAPDYTGVVEFLRKNWCLNGRTVVADIRRILPGQTVAFDVSTGELTIVENSQLWSGVAEDRVAPTDEELWQLLLEAVRANAGPNAVAGLMLSGGWDSRVLLAALTQVFGDRLVTLSHGAPHHGELELARGLAARAGAHHLEVLLGEDSLGRPQDLDALLNTTDAILFPWWRFAGRALDEASCNTAFCGVLGEVLGGHYTVVGRGRAQRAREVFQRAVLRSTRHSVAPIDGLRRVLKQDYRPRRIPFVKKEVTSAFEQQISAAIEDDIEKVIGRYAQRGIGDAGRMVEAYTTEYRGLHYICQQPLTLTKQLDVALPLGSPPLVEAVLAVPLTRRIHNSLSRSLLRRFRPELLALPLAASPFVSAGAPILVQESGRIVRRVVDRVSRQAYLLSAGRRGAMRRYGWVDFESDVRAGDFLDAWRESLSWDGLDRQAIDQYVTGIKTHQAPVKLARPMLKLAYLDRLFGKGFD
jgi:hypothetical protein